MRLDRLITLGLVSPLRRVLGRSIDQSKRLPILMYHSISDDPESEVHPYFKVCTSPRRFAEQMQWLAEAGYRGVTLSEGLAWLNEPDPGSKGQMPSAKGQVPGYGKQVPSSTVQVSRDQTPYPISDVPSPRAQSQVPRAKNQDPISHLPDPKLQTPPAKLVAITFDDGFRDFHTAAAPALQRHGFTATMYLPTAFIGDERKSFKSRECLTWSEVKELADAGMEFGSHTVNHPRIVRLQWSEIEYELRQSRTEIGQRLGLTPPSFAYPFGFPQAEKTFVQKFKKLLRQTGYQSCVTTTIGRASPGDDALNLVRLPANSADDRTLFEAKLRGSYDWLATAQVLTKQIAKGVRPGARPAALRLRVG